MAPPPPAWVWVAVTGALAAGVGERTVFRRLQDPDFEKQVAAARAAMLNQAVAQLARLSTVATTALEGLLGDATPSSVRLGAARSVLELGSRLRESEELERRIAEVEARLAASDQKGLGR